MLFELGLKLTQQDINDMVFMDKVLYRSKGCAIWGEYELDYVFFLKKDFSDSDFSFNREEVDEWEWVAEPDLPAFLHDKITTPWFQKILNENLADWWARIRQ